VDGFVFVQLETTPLTQLCNSKPTLNSRQFPFEKNTMIGRTNRHSIGIKVKCLDNSNITGLLFSKVIAETY
jgi:hypothetical protein